MDQGFVAHPASPLLDHCPKSLPANAYYDPEWFAAENRTIWSNQWIYVGRLNDLNPMSMRRISLAGQNLILIRDADSGISCFYNTCRHRGSELCTTAEKAMKSKLITCPYHQWSYDLSGRLVRAPYVLETPDFNRADHGLFPVHFHLWNGCIFLCLADTPPDFAASPDLGADALDHWPMSDLVTGHSWTKVLNCNWKIFWENYNECLHCPGIHPELCDMVPVYRQGIMAENEAPGWTPDQPQGPSLKAGARSWTMNGEPCGPEFEHLTEAQRSVGQTFVTLLPTAFFVAHVDYVRIVSLRPLGPEMTELKAEWLFLPETMTQPGFDIDNVVKFATLVMSQDGEACEMNQRGLKNRPFEQGTLMPQEFDVYRFHQWIRQTMQ